MRRNPFPQLQREMRRAAEQAQKSAATAARQPPNPQGSDTAGFTHPDTGEWHAYGLTGITDTTDFWAG